mmetsp:Transcript_26247/g.23116  ORF Transcript_26247/g.23116 Transcript_26247/m.23116 type:complete len:106 (+) Transcript_26247:340-657(+)
MKNVQVDLERNREINSWVIKQNSDNYMNRGFVFRVSYTNYFILVMLVLQFKAVRQGINMNLATMNNMNAMQAQQGWGQPMGGMQGGMQGGQMNMQAGGQMPNNNI